MVCELTTIDESSSTCLPDEKEILIDWWILGPWIPPISLAEPSTKYLSALGMVESLAIFIITNSVSVRKFLSLPAR